MDDPTYVCPGDTLKDEIVALERRREFFRNRIEESEREIDALDRKIAAMRAELSTKAGAK